MIASSWWRPLGGCSHRRRQQFRITEEWEWSRPHMTEQCISALKTWSKCVLALSRECNKSTQSKVNQAPTVLVLCSRVNSRKKRKKIPLVIGMWTNHPRLPVRVHITPSPGRTRQYMTATINRNYNLQCHILSLDAGFIPCIFHSWYANLNQFNLELYSLFIENLTHAANYIPIRLMNSIYCNN